ncbi:17630_t:CDS:2 [Dentiscutata erythropus]|uniref:17630_t:CDS:1 n=1 Tax=Dentiscutata erythropus TaxID=1348616 RepID=A0A9N9A952_9GLOM|nr:17630_t:CDS:2 [Dentiscutata erythropus]
MPGRILFRYSREEVSKHNTQKKLWVIHNNKVYDLTEFALDHPGGAEILLEWGGQDVTKIMTDPTLHEHTKSAYELLADSCIGEVVDNTVASTTQSKDVGTIFDERTIDKFRPETTDIKSDLNEKFLNLNKPLFAQMFNCNFSKEFYLKQIHQPRHLPYSARLFANPMLELLTKTPWYAIPILWFPVISYYLYTASGSLGSRTIIVLFLFGIGIWTLLEYTLHRFLFHVDTILPDHPYALSVHFALHGIHHYLPMDRLRLVMPPILGASIAYPIIQLGYIIFPENIACALIAGAIFGYPALEGDEDISPSSPL